MTTMQVIPGELRSHAGDVLHAAGRVGKAGAAAGGALAISPAAFGVLCGFFAAPCVAMSAAAITTVGAMQSGATKRSGAVRACAADYEAADEQVQSAFTTLQGKLA